MTGPSVSTIHAAVGAFLGVGLARGIQGLLDLGILVRIMAHWIIAVTIGADTAAFIFMLLKAIFWERELLDSFWQIYYGALRSRTCSSMRERRLSAGCSLSEQWKTISRAIGTGLTS